MNVVETQWWIIDLPPEWQAEEDEETILISDEDGVGEIAITTLEKSDGAVSDAELREFSLEVEQQFGGGQAVSLDELQGYYFCYSDDGDAVRDWYLRCDNLALLITYSCAEDNAGMDDAAVNEILSTLFIKTAE
ncbi:hypothetical protein NO559_14590 [Dasania sp. GY-MA-18]|uniref:Uncharacterized protein n=1 Tax=Dasania phycosphaerae TaxID=2950436 RepID=A0A9J6RR97_9GAMM|nr:MULTISPECIES: hypothetical protein [Dasania]MCR8924008.1 hypothetical protein [Dasania sp. GY-MA-18]MCZ0866581.1 hypothetical protein [Dasania phycosphaerae]MCZ0870166.1 hypothetical protein [Dasania phycosphaerae]